MSDVPRAMRAAVLYDETDIRIEERPVPEIGEGELLVRTRACGICSGDIVGWYVRRKAPLVFGHEPAGEIVKVRGAPRAESGAVFRRGDRVFVHHHAPCFACDACGRKEYVQCTQWAKTALDPGGMAEYFRVPAENVRDTLRLPASVSFADAALVEPVACVVKSLRRSGAKPGDSMLVIGLGVMGQLHALVARSMGVEVIGSDFIAERRRLAARNGARAVHPEDVDRGFDVVICGPATAQAMNSAIAAVRPGGTVVMFTPFDPKDRVRIDEEQFYFRDVRLVASYSCGPDDTRAALALIERGIVTTERIEATTFALDRVCDAYRALAGAEIIKPIVTLP